MSRMLCLRWALYLRSMSTHAEAIGIKTYCIETALPQGRKALARFVVVGFAMCVCAWPPEASPGSGLKPVIRDPISQFITLARNCAKTNGVRFSVVVFHAYRSRAKIIAQLGVSWSAHCGFRPTAWEVSTPANRFRKSSGSFFNDLISYCVHCFVRCMSLFSFKKCSARFMKSMVLFGKCG